MGRSFFTASSVKPWDFTDGLSMYGQSRAILLGKCTRYHLFSGYQEQFRYVFALGLSPTYNFIVINILYFAVFYYICNIYSDVQLS